MGNCHENRRKAEIGDNEPALDLSVLAAWGAALKEGAGVVKMDRGDVRVQILCTLTELEHAAARELGPSVKPYGFSEIPKIYRPHQFCLDSNRMQSKIGRVAGYLWASAQDSVSRCLVALEFTPKLNCTRPIGQSCNLERGGHGSTNFTLGGLDSCPASIRLPP